MGGDSFSFTIEPVHMEPGSTRIGNWILWRFQEEVLSRISKKKDMLLTAPTGAGKTLTLLLAEEGSVGLYPNNTLLLDQQKSIHKILVEALDASYEALYTTPDGVDVLRVYKPGKRGEAGASSYSKIAVILLSGRYIGYEIDRHGRLIPKRQVILERIVEKFCYPRPGEGKTYTITLATPDTALLISAGIYRDFEKVGYTFHDLVVGAREGRQLDFILSKYQVATSSELSIITRIRQCLLEYPWFIDEFHLYGVYETSSIIPILQVYRNMLGLDEPVVLSSATPGGALYEELAHTLDLRTVKAGISSRGDESTLIRGETTVEVVPVDTPGPAVSRWLRLGESVPSITRSRIDLIRKTIADGGNVFIIVDRVNQIPPITSILLEEGLNAECKVSVRPPGCSDGEEPIVVGSEAISQGIDRRNVKYGIVSAYNSTSLIQRIGRIGRKTSSTITVPVPLTKHEVPFEQLDGSSIDYYSFTRRVEQTYPSIDFSHLDKTKAYQRIAYIRREILENLTIVSITQVSNRSLTGELSEKLEKLSYILDKFYGPPETIASLLTFRSTGFTVIAEKPDGSEDEVEISTLLRNYSVEDVKTTIKNGKKIPLIKISLNPSRMKLVLDLPYRERCPKIKDDIALYVEGMFTTIGELRNMCFELKIKPWSPGTGGVEYTIPQTPDTDSQPIAVASLPNELLTAFTYTLRAAEVYAGSRRLAAILL